MNSIKVNIEKNSKENEEKSADLTIGHLQSRERDDKKRFGIGNWK